MSVHLSRRCAAASGISGGGETRDSFTPGCTVSFLTRSCFHSRMLFSHLRKELVGQWDQSLTFSRPPKRSIGQSFFMLVCNGTYGLKQEEFKRPLFFFRKSHCGALQHRKICPLPLILPPTIDSRSPPSSKSQERSIIYAVFTYWCVEYKFTPLEGSVISAIAIN